jgi:hypothetical protein
MATVRLSKSFFTHTPKTGGTWITEVLRRCGLEKEALPLSLCHTPGTWLLRRREYARFHGLPFFAFTRHPAAWYQAFWRDRMKHGWHDSDFDRTVRSENFNEFVSKCLQAYPRHVTSLYLKYAEKAAYVGRLEVVAESLVWILGQLGETFDPAVVYDTPPINVSSGDPTLDRSCRYTPEILAKVLEMERPGIERFGYSFKGQSDS